MTTACVLLAGCGSGSTDPPPAPAAIAVVSGSGQTAYARDAFTEPVVVKVTNATGAGAGGVGVTFSAPAGAATLDPAATTTDAQGLARTTVTAGDTPGPLTVTARAGNLDQVATAALTVQPAGARFAGQWQGSTGQSLPVYLRVGGTGLIDSLTVRMTATFGPSSCTGTVVKTAVPIGTDGSFETPVGIGFRVTLRGQFTPAMVVSGSIAGHTGPFAALCGTTVLLGTGTPFTETTWQAQRR